MTLRGSPYLCPVKQTLGGREEELGFQLTRRKRRRAKWAITNFEFVDNNIISIMSDNITLAQEHPTRVESTYAMIGLS